MDSKSIAKTAVRAESALGHGITYQLGKGGYWPKDSLPTRTKTCDCSGFVAWTLGLSRLPKITRLWWIETSNIYRDATTKKQTFTQIKDPVRGCLVVYPDKDGRQGHVAVWLNKGDQGGDEVIDCSSSRGITKRTTSVFERNKAIYCVLTQYVK